MRKHTLTGLIVWLFLATGTTQTPTDLTFVPRGFICAGLNFGTNSWTDYWEGEILQSNGNIGTVTRNQIGLGVNVGVRDWANVILMLPWVSTNASQGTLNGQAGLQDISLFLKAVYLDRQIGPGYLVLGGNVGFSMPVSNYLVDFAPLNIGWGTTNLSLRQMASYSTEKGFFVGLKGNYTYRSNIGSIHRDFYYDQGQAHYGNEVMVHDIFDWTTAIGYNTGRLLLEVDLNGVNTLGGSDIRAWDPGFPTNNMDFTTLTGRFDYYFTEGRGFNISLTGGTTLAGRNVGKAVFGNLTLNYLFPVWGQNQTDTPSID